VKLESFSIVAFPSGIQSRIYWYFKFLRKTEITTSISWTQLLFTSFPWERL